MLEHRSPLLQAIPRFALIGLCALYLTESTAGPAVFGALVRGNFLLFHGFKFHEDPWSLVGDGHEWLDPNWIFDVAVSLVWNWSGESGLLLLTITSNILLAFSACGALSFRSGDRIIGTLLGLMLTAGVLHRSGLSAELWGLVLLFGVLESDRRDRVLLAVIFSILAWNVQGSAALSFLLLAPTRRWRAVPYLLVGVISPYFGKQAIFSGEYLAGLISSGMLEGFTLASPLNYRSAFFVLLVGFYGIGCWRLRSVPSPFVMLLGAGTLLVVELLPCAMFATSYAAATNWPLLRAEEPLRQSSESLGRILSYFSGERERLAISFLLLCLGFVQAVPLFRSPMINVLLPVREVDRIVEQQLPPPLLHDGVIGSYLAYRFSSAYGEPSHRVLLDDRAPAFSPSLWASAGSFLTADPSPVLERIRPQSALCRRTDRLCSYLETDEHWRVVDAEGALVKSDPEQGSPHRQPVWRLYARR